MCINKFFGHWISLKQKKSIASGNTGILGETEEEVRLPQKLPAWEARGNKLEFDTFRSVILANTKFVRASPTAILAPHAGSTRPLIGCSPMAVAEPTVSKCVSAVTATSATGVCNGPTHCCWATRPVTLRSTLSTH